MADWNEPSKLITPILNKEIKKYNNIKLIVMNFMNELPFGIKVLPLIEMYYNGLEYTTLAETQNITSKLSIDLDTLSREE